MVDNVSPFLDQKDIQNFKIISRDNNRKLKTIKPAIHVRRVDSKNYKDAMAEYETINLKFPEFSFQ